MGLPERQQAVRKTLEQKLNLDHKRKKERLRNRWRLRSHTNKPEANSTRKAAILNSILLKIATNKPRSIFMDISGRSMSYNYMVTAIEEVCGAQIIRSRDEKIANIMTIESRVNFRRERINVNKQRKNQNGNLQDTESGYLRRKHKEKVKGFRALIKARRFKLEDLINVAAFKSEDTIIKARRTWEKIQKLCENGSIARRHIKSGVKSCIKDKGRNYVKKLIRKGSIMNGDLPIPK